jgi:hypothetical protein
MVTVQEVVLTGEAKDVDYMSKLGLMKGHLLVAKELLDQNQPKQAEPHMDIQLRRFMLMLKTN